MIELNSRLERLEADYEEMRGRLERHQFTLGGNWEYDAGSFDRSLDGEKQTVWLRIPFRVLHGKLDNQSSQPGTRVRIGTPYVLRHQYETGEDHTAQFRTYGALVDQFQPPVDPDADVQASYVKTAKQVLQEVERSFF